MHKNHQYLLCETIFGYSSLSLDMVELVRAKGNCEWCALNDYRNHINLDKDDVVINRKKILFGHARCGNSWLCQ